MSRKGLIDAAVEHLRTSASVKTVYGDPVRVDGKTFIPVAKVAYGFGGGTARHQKSDTTTTTKQPVPDTTPVTGAGGGVAAKPVGVVEIGAGETKFVAFGQAKRLAIAAVIGSAFGFLFGAVLRRKERKA